jgi:hypothetical protein
MGGGQSTSNGGVCTIAIEGFSTQPASGNNNTGDGTTSGGIGAPLTYGDLITLQTQSNGWVIGDTANNCYLDASNDVVPTQVFQFVVLNATSPNSIGTIVMDGDSVILVAFKGDNQALNDCTDSSGTPCDWFYLRQSAEGAAPWPVWYDASDAGAGNATGSGGTVAAQYWYIRDFTSLSDSNYLNPLSENDNGAVSNGPIRYGTQIAFGAGLSGGSATNGHYITYYGPGATTGGYGNFNTSSWDGDAQYAGFTLYSASQPGQPVTPLVASASTPCTNGGTYANDGTTTTGSGSSIACKPPGGVLTYSPSTCTVSCTATSDACNSAAPQAPNPLVCTGGANCTNGKCTNPDDVPTWDCTQGVWACQPGSSSNVIMYALIGAGVLIGLMILYLIISGMSGSGDDLQRILSQPQ